MSSKTLAASYRGIVTKFNSPPNISEVTLTNVETRQSTNTTATSEKLLERGIDHDGCEFEILIYLNEHNIPEPIFKKITNEITNEITYDI